MRKPLNYILLGTANTKSQSSQDKVSAEQSSLLVVCTCRSRVTMCPESRPLSGSLVKPTNLRTLSQLQQMIAESAHLCTCTCAKTAACLQKSNQPWDAGQLSEQLLHEALQKGKLHSGKTVYFPAVCFQRAELFLSNQLGEKVFVITHFLPSLLVTVTSTSPPDCSLCSSKNHIYCFCKWKTNQFIQLLVSQIIKFHGLTSK